MHVFYMGNFKKKYELESVLVHFSWYLDRNEEWKPHIANLDKTVDTLWAGFKRKNTNYIVTYWFIIN